MSTKEQNTHDDIQMIEVDTSEKTVGRILGIIATLNARIGTLERELARVGDALGTRIERLEIKHHKL